VRYRALAKNAHRLVVTCALANLFMAHLNAHERATDRKRSQKAWKSAVLTSSNVQRMQPPPGTAVQASSSISAGCWPGKAPQVSKWRRAWRRTLLYRLLSNPIYTGWIAQRLRSDIDRTGNPHVISGLCLTAGGARCGGASIVPRRKSQGCPSDCRRVLSDPADRRLLTLTRRRKRSTGHQVDGARTTPCPGRTARSECSRRDRFAGRGGDRSG
jgi:hypothetical protein